MGLMLDSSVIIAAERQRFDMVAFLKTEAAHEDVFISSATASELLHGVFRAKGERRVRREQFVEAVLVETPVLPFDLAVARVHAELWAGLEAAGIRIGAHDMVIAATCLKYGLQLATLNEGEFSRVAGLTLANARPYAS